MSDNLLKPQHWVREGGCTPELKGNYQQKTYNSCNHLSKLA